MNIAITTNVHKWQYIGINIPITFTVFELVEELKKDYEWRLDVGAFGGTIQGILETDNLDVAIEIGQRILDLEEETTIMINNCDIDNETIISNNVGENPLKCMINPGRLLDDFVRNGDAGIYIFEEKKFL